MTALSQSIYAATDIDRFMDAEIREVTARAHARITEAIRAQDGPAAMRRMARHVCGFARAAAEADQRQRVALPEPADD